VDRNTSRRTRIALAIAGVLILTFVLGVAAAGGVFVGWHLNSSSPSREPTPPTVQPATPSSTTPASAPTPSAQTALAADFAQLQQRLQARIGVAIAPAGNGNSPWIFGDWQSGPAWSTIKVPLAIAALREEGSSQVTDAMRAAITESDNAAAESIWASLGTPVIAAHKVEQILQETGDNHTVVQSEKVRPEFTAFGQTDWPLTEQARFLAVAACDDRNTPILDLMGQVEAGQSWGIGTIPGTRFKGGWGPSLSGSYLVRQIGLLETNNRTVSVAIAAQPDSGFFDDGVGDLNEVTNWLTEHMAELPAGQCGT